MRQIFRNKWAVIRMIIALAIIAAIAIVIAPTFGGLGIDSGLFDQEGCKPPCWHNLTPGLSSADDVDDFLSNLSRINWPTRNVYVPGAGCESLQLIDKFRLEDVDLYVVDGKLTFIRSFHPSKKIKLEKIVDYFGNPEYFMAISEIGVDYRTQTLEVYYPSKGLGFEIYLDQDKSIDRIQLDMEAMAIHYFEPGDLSSYYISRYPCYPSAEQDNSDKFIQKFIQKWHGFGPIDVIIYDPFAPDP